MFTVSKENSVSNIKAEVKTKLIAEFVEYLTEKYGEDSVGMVRTGSTSKTNEIGFIIDEVTGEDGSINPLVATINPTVKEFANRKTDKRVYTAFDFAAARNAYDAYIDEKSAKMAEKAEAKAKKIASDEKARAKKAAEKTED